MVIIIYHHIWISNYKYMVYIHILHIHVYMYCTSIYCQNPPSLTSLPKTSKTRCRASNRLTSCGHDRDCGNVHVCAPGGVNLQAPSINLERINVHPKCSWDCNPPLSLSLSFVLKLNHLRFGAKWFSWYSRPSLSKPLREVGALSGNLQDIWSDDHQDWITVPTGYGVSIFDRQLKPLQILNKANPLTWIIAWFFPMQKQDFNGSGMLLSLLPVRFSPCLCPSFLCLDPSLYPGPSPSPSRDPSPYPSPSLETFPSPCRDPGAPYDLPPAKAGWMNKLDSNAIHQVPYAIRFSRFSQQLYHKGCIR